MTPWWIPNGVQPWTKQLQEHMREPRVSTVTLEDFQTKATLEKKEKRKRNWEVLVMGRVVVKCFGDFFSGKKAGKKFYNGKKREDDRIFFLAEYFFDRSWTMARRFREEVGTWHVGQSTLWTRRFNERGEMNSKKPNPTGTGIPNHQHM